MIPIKMKQAKFLFKRINDHACGEGGFLLGTCRRSMNGRKNYLGLFLGAGLVQYVFPFALMIVLAPLVLGNIIAGGVIEFLRMLNPFFVLLYLPVTFIDAIAIGVIAIIIIIGSISFWYLFYREIGVFTLLPLGAWLLAVVLWFIPVIGPVLSILVSAFPWLPLMILLHWWVHI